MKCPFCTHKTKIYNTRSTHYNTQTWRRHRCLNCSSAFTTKEKIDWTGAVTVRTAESSTPYEKERILLSVARASEKITVPPSTIVELTDSIELALQKNNFFSEKVQSAQIITEVSLAVLHRFEPHLGIQYINNVYRNKPPLELIKKLLA